MGPKFSKDASKTAVITRALHGLKSAGAAFRSYLSKCMESMGYMSFKADSNLWLKLGISPEDGLQYYSYLFCHVGDILCIHQNGDVLQWLHNFFPLKQRFGNPETYLGTKLHKTRLHNGVWAWAMSPVKYIQEAVRNCAAHLVAKYSSRFGLPKRAQNPFGKSYDPELDISPELEPETTYYFETVIGVLRWMIELRRIGIITEVLSLS